jgi:hypothetical protein
MNRYLQLLEKLNKKSPVSVLFGQWMAMEVSWDVCLAGTLKHSFGVGEQIKAKDSRMERMVDRAIHYFHMATAMDIRRESTKLEA